jgi:predicted ribosome quality control (RQC) complex YloA/Tae2 family protein
MVLHDLTPQEINRSVKEINSTLKGSQISKIVEPTPLSILFHTKRGNVLINTEPGFSHISLSNKSRSRGISSAFCMLLRKHLGNTKIENITIEVAGDRIVRFKLINGFSLIVELTGRHGNIFLLSETSSILGSLNRSSSTKRDLKIESIWTAPAFRPVIPKEPRFINCLEIEEFFLSQKSLFLDDKIVSTYLKEQRKELKKKEKILNLLKKEQIKIKGLINQKRVGELLLIVQWSWPKGKREYYCDPALDGGDPIQLELPIGYDTPVKAAQYYFKLYKKGKRGEEKVQQRRSQLEKEKEAILKLISNTTSIPSDTLKLWYQKQQLKIEKRKNRSRGTKKKKVDIKKKAYRQFFSRDLTPILVGKGAKENQILTFSVARGRDYWFHIRDHRGSHVIVVSNKDLSEEILLDAASLALFYSDARNNKRGEVIYTQKKYVRSLKGSPGKVSLAKSSNISIVIEDDRMERLWNSAKEQ